MRARNALKGRRHLQTPPVDVRPFARSAEGKHYNGATKVLFIGGGGATNNKLEIEREKSVE